MEGICDKNASVVTLQQQSFDFFENIILNLITKYKQDSNFSCWYAAVGDSYDGNIYENFISIGLVDKEKKILMSRIRIPKNEIGTKVINKFLKSYLVAGIKSTKIQQIENEKFKNIAYIITNDYRYLEIYTKQEQLTITDNLIGLDLINNYDDKPINYETKQMLEETQNTLEKSAIERANNSSQLITNDQATEINEDLDDINDKLNYLDRMLNMK